LATPWPGGGDEAKTGQKPQEKRLVPEKPIAFRRRFRGALQADERLNCLQWASPFALFIAYARDCWPSHAIKIRSPTPLASAYRIFKIVLT